MRFSEYFVKGVNFLRLYYNCFLVKWGFRKVLPAYFINKIKVVSKGKEYSAIIEDVLSEDKIAERALIKEMCKDNDTELRYVMAVWKTSSGVDMPSYDFRKMLCRMNPENKNAAIFMNETANYTVVPLGATMANFDFLNEEDDIFH